MARIGEAIGRYNGGALSCVEAGEFLGISERHFRRLRDCHEAQGAEGLMDRRRGKASGRRGGFSIASHGTHSAANLDDHLHAAVQRAPFGIVGSVGPCIWSHGSSRAVALRRQLL